MIAVNTNPYYTARECRHQFQDSGTKAVIVCEDQIKTLNKVIGQSKINRVIYSTIGEELIGESQRCKKSIKRLNNISSSNIVSFS